MFLIVTTILLIVVFFISKPAIRAISRPLNANYPFAARLVRAFLWVFVLALATWPVGVGPLMFKLECAYLTKFQVEPTIDARSTGYVDERLSNLEYLESHMDGVYFRKDVDDLLAGRIAFFEMKRIQRGPQDEKLLPYLRYSLMDFGSPNCKPEMVGVTAGKGWIDITNPQKCLGIEAVLSPTSRYQIRDSGNTNTSDGSTEIFERSNNRVVAVFRSFAFSFYGSSSVCPNVSVEGETYRPHFELTKLVFIDANQAVRKAVLR